MKKIVFASLLSVLFLAACSDDNSKVESDLGMYDNGFFVLNEGSFSAGDGSLSFVSNDLETVEHEIYFAANPTKSLGLGSVLQSVFFYGENAYIISNVSNLITVVNRFSFEFVGEIVGDLNAPRYGAVANGKAFVTNQASWQTSDDDFIAVINLETLEVEKTIQTHAAVEYILEKNGKLYVQNASFSVGSEISVINPQTSAVEETIEMGAALNGIDIENNTLYAMVSSGIKTMDLGTKEISNLVDFPDDSVFANLEVENNRIYYTGGNKVFSFEINAPEIPLTPIIEANDVSVLYGFAVEGTKIYMADAGDFTSKGHIYIYDNSGSKLKEFPVGVAPNGFYFND